MNIVVHLLCAQMILSLVKPRAHSVCTLYLDIHVCSENDMNLIRTLIQQISISFEDEVRSWSCTLKFLNFRTQENHAVINLNSNKDSKAKGILSK